MVAWEKICLPKKQGGLGVLDLKVMNKTLLAKWLWQWAARDYGIWGNLVRKLQNDAYSRLPLYSPLLHAFKAIDPILSVAVSVIPRDGKNVLFWHQNWGYGLLRYQLTDLYSFAFDTGITLRDFLTSWPNNDELFRDLLHSSSSANSQLLYLTNLISNLQLETEGTSDDYTWKLNANGSFSVSSMYRLQKHYPKEDSALVAFWSFKIQPRMKIFFWQMAIDKLATIDNLKRRGWKMPNCCILCKNNEETTRHIFGDCSFFQQSMFMACSWTGIQLDGLASFLTNSSSSNLQRDLLATLAFVTWRERCSRIFRGVYLRPEDMASQAVAECKILNPAFCLPS
ncbi:RNA-directed DNA polymerase (reverse transcriptase)-related family protein [Rhynchospora pubera]|uniref:RNA-directed DNA polymerase (Reverse transcriptase)-related family protein n=1 Tax=Rhynchospora pubera TaxID=906938 RepID=A0AAV8DYW3_9POAL|nr:RNA-directed DNA polymerase (reverse transcriptase)-related family protein [Rhynchospora pubera]